jgi:hypothetical protein
MKRIQDVKNETEDIITDALFDMEGDLLILPKYLNGWSDYVNGELTPHIKYVIWPKGNNTSEWNGQIPQKIPGDYALVTEPFKQDDKMVFVHGTGFFCVAPDKETMLEYIKNKDNDMVNQADSIMEKFDFEKVHKIMNFLDWRYIDKPPVMEDIKNTARHVLYKACATENDTSLGGFTASVKQYNPLDKDDKTLVLTFCIETRYG